jgi:hypothetical protein
LNLSSTIVTLLFPFLLLPVSRAGNSTEETGKVILENEVKHEAIASALDNTVNSLYDSLQLEHMGMDREALLYAFEGQQKLALKGKLSEPDILTICDFSQSSGRKRMYIIDVKHYKLLLNTYVAHGKNSGLEYAERFSNNMKSHQSSLGFYITGNTYHGKHGLSLKLSGQENGINDNAEARALVVHGANYIGPNRSGSTYMGRSFGCPAVPIKQTALVINLIKKGSCLFIYHPSKNYLRKSVILNEQE